MSATDDRTYAEVGRQMARWLAENDPHATPLTTAAGGDRLRGLPAARIEDMLGDTLTWFAKGYLAGVAYALAHPDDFTAQEAAAPVPPEYTE